MANKPGKWPGTYEAVLSASPTEVEIRRKEWRAATEDTADRAIEFEDKLLASEWCEEDARRVFDAFKREEARRDVAAIKLAEAVTDADRRGRLPRVRRSLSPEESERRIRLIKAGLNPDRVTEARKALLEEVRPKPSDGDDPERLERLVTDVDSACNRKRIRPSKTDKCVKVIRPLLLPENRHAPVRWLKEALGKAKERRAAQEK
jgi:hypothetical protein